MKLALRTLSSLIAHCRNNALLAIAMLAYGLSADAQCGLSLSLTGSTSTCAGIDTLTLTGADTTASIEWQNAAGASLHTSTSPATDSSYIPAVGGSYVAIVTTLSGCIDTTAAISVDSTFTPSVSITATTSTLCSNASDTFTATVSGAGSAPGYQWYQNGTVVSTADTFITSTISDADSVWLVVTSAAACTTAPTATSNTLHLTVYAPSTIDTVIAAFCKGDSIVVGGQAFYTNGTHRDTIRGAGVNGCDSLVVIRLTVYAPAHSITKTICLGQSYSVGTNSYTSTGTYIDTLNGTSVHGCDSIVTLHLTVDTLIPASVSIAAGTSDTICANTVVDLYATAVNGGNNPDFQWKINGINVGNSPTYIANPILNGDVVTCILTSSVACPTPAKDTSNTITFTVIPYPAAHISLSGTGAICAGDSISLLASGGSSYVWSNGATDQVIYASATGTYRVTATNSYGCTAASPPVSVTALSPLTDSITVSGDTLSSLPSEFYQWYYNGAIIGNAVTQTFVATESGQYQVSTIDSNGCQAISPFYDLIGDGIANIHSDMSVKMYPNPNTGIFSLEFSDDQPRTVAVIDLMGNMVTENVNVARQSQFDLHTLTDGIYYLRIAQSGTIKTVKFSVVK